jgi:flagellar export protein FliJ
MPGEVFKFAEQVALDHAAGERDQCTRNLAEAQSALQVAEAQLRRCDSALTHAERCTREAADDLARPRAAVGSELAQRHRFVASLRDKEAASRLALKAQQQAVHAAREHLAECRVRLGAADARVKSLEQLRERQRLAFERLRTRRQDAAHDEAAIQGFARRAREDAAKPKDP